MTSRALALLLLVVGCAAAYGWQFVPPERAAIVWNMTGALYRVFLLALVALTLRSRTIAAVALLLAAFDLMVAGCSGLYMLAPWPILPGDERCSTRFNLPLGLVGSVIALVLAANIVRGKR